MASDENNERPVIYKRRIQGIDLSSKPIIKVPENKIFDNCKSCRMATRTTEEGRCTSCRAWKPKIVFYD